MGGCCLAAPCFFPAKKIRERFIAPVTGQEITDPAVIGSPERGRRGRGNRPQISIFETAIHLGTSGMTEGLLPDLLNIRCEFQRTMRFFEGGSPALAGGPCIHVANFAFGGSEEVRKIPGASTPQCHHPTCRNTMNHRLYSRCAGVLICESDFLSPRFTTT